MKYRVFDTEVFDDITDEYPWVITPDGKLYSCNYDNLRSYPCLYSSPKAVFYPAEKLKDEKMKMCPLCGDAWMCTGEYNASTDCTTYGYKVHCRCGYSLRNHIWSTTKEEAINIWNSQC